jgi:hypothetical protein
MPGGPLEDGDLLLRAAVGATAGGFMVDDPELR